MRLLRSIVPQLLLAGSAFVSAASWSFTDGSVSVSEKGSGSSKENLKPSTPLSKPLTLSHAATLKLLLTTTSSSTPKRAHQVFLTLSHPSNPSLTDAYPLTTKDNGKSILSLTFKDIPLQLLKANEPLDAAIIIGSFGAGVDGYKAQAFKLNIEVDPNVALPGESAAEGGVALEAGQLRYAALPEIHHVFRADPTSPPKIVTLVFLAGVLASLPLLFGAWLSLGGNVNHLGKALGAAPVAHVLFVGSVVAMEGLFALYYLSWSLFEVLPVAGIVGVVGFYSGSRALGEVQERRLAGLR